MQACISRGDVSHRSGIEEQSMFTGLFLSVVNRMQWQTQDQRKGKRTLHFTRRKRNCYSNESNDQQDQKRIHFTLSNRFEDELAAVVVPSLIRTCSLQFSNDWQTSHFLPPPPHLIGGFDTYVQITDVFCEGHIVFVDVCFVAKGENFFRLERMPSILSLHQQHIQCVHVFNVQSQKKKKITWPRETLVLARNVSLGKLLRLSFGITQFKSNAPS